MRIAPHVEQKMIFNITFSLDGGQYRIVYNTVLVNA